MEKRRRTRVEEAGYSARKNFRKYATFSRPYTIFSSPKQHKCERSQYLRQLGQQDLRKLSKTPAEERASIRADVFVHRHSYFFFFRSMYASNSLRIRMEEGGDMARAPEYAVGASNENEIREDDCALHQTPLRRTSPSSLYDVLIRVHTTF